MEPLMPDVMDTTTIPQADELEQFVRELDDSTNTYPKDAIAKARLNKYAIIPKLIQAIDRAVTEVKAEGVVSGNAALFGICLLAEFHAKEALPVVLRALACRAVPVGRTARAAR